MSRTPTTPAIPDKDATPSGLRKRSLWTLVFIAIAALTIWAITSQNKHFSLDSFREFLGGLNYFWVAVAVLAMLAYIGFEGLALLTLAKSLGYRRSLRKGYSYSAADIYFSSITPSATGGQPASAFLMIKDGIPVSTVTVILLINLIMYTFAILVLGVASFLIVPFMFGHFSTPSRILIIIGFAMQVLLASFFILLLRKTSILRWMGTKIISLLCKLHLMRRKEMKLAKLNTTLDAYESCVLTLGKRRSALVKAFFLNLLQRTMLITVTACSFLAAGGSFSDIIAFSGGECMVILGYNFVPVPGAMGIADGLLLDVFGSFLGDGTLATNLELLSRSISFYLCVALCGISFLCRCIFISRKKDASAEEAEQSPSENDTDAE